MDVPHWIFTHVVPLVLQQYFSFNLALNEATREKKKLFFGTASFFYEGYCVLVMKELSPFILAETKRKIKNGVQKWKEI